jgi:hypothetical protein
VERYLQACLTAKVKAIATSSCHRKVGRVEMGREERGVRHSGCASVGAESWSESTAMNDEQSWRMPRRTSLASCEVKENRKTQTCPVKFAADSLDRVAASCLLGVQGERSEQQRPKGLKQNGKGCSGGYTRFFKVPPLHGPAQSQELTGCRRVSCGVISLQKGDGSLGVLAGTERPRSSSLSYPSPKTYSKDRAGPLRA